MYLYLFATASTTNPQEMAAIHTFLNDATEKRFATTIRRTEGELRELQRGNEGDSEVMRLWELVKPEWLRLTKANYEGPVVARPAPVAGIAEHTISVHDPEVVPAAALQRPFVACSPHQPSKRAKMTAGVPAHLRAKKGGSQETCAVPTRTAQKESRCNGEQNTTADKPPCRAENKRKREARAERAVVPKLAFGVVSRDTGLQVPVVDEFEQERQRLVSSLWDDSRQLPSGKQSLKIVGVGEGLCHTQWVPYPNPMPFVSVPAAASKDLDVRTQKDARFSGVSTEVDAGYLEQGNRVTAIDRCVTLLPQAHRMLHPENAGRVHDCMRPDNVYPTLQSEKADLPDCDYLAVNGLEYDRDANAVAADERMFDLVRPDPFAYQYLHAQRPKGMQADERDNLYYGVRKVYRQKVLDKVRGGRRT